MRIPNALHIDLTEILHVLWSAEDVIFTSTMNSAEFHGHLLTIEAAFHAFRVQAALSPTLPIARLVDEPFRSRFVDLQNHLVHLREAGGQLDLLLLRLPGNGRYVVFAQILASEGWTDAIQDSIAALDGLFTSALSDGGNA